MTPFGQKEAEAVIAHTLDQPVSALFSSLGPPVAAASIAQVHRAQTKDGRTVAVKVLRPGVERGFRSDLDAFYFVARNAEGNLGRSVAAAAGRGRRYAGALGEDRDGFTAGGRRALRDGGEHQRGLRFPGAAGRLEPYRERRADDGVDRRHAACRIALALTAKGYDLPQLGGIVIQSFLRHAMRDGFFHADMHPGNLFVDAEGKLTAVDFGIMGRLDDKERRFLAEILPRLHHPQLSPYRGGAFRGWLRASASFGR